MTEPGFTGLTGSPDRFPDVESEPVFSIYSSTDIFYAVGVEPDAKDGPGGFFRPRLPSKSSLVIVGAAKGLSGCLRSF
jgi:hypothetical protein